VQRVPLRLRWRNAAGNNRFTALTGRRVPQNTLVVDAPRTAQDYGCCGPSTSQCSAAERISLVPHSHIVVLVDVVVADKLSTVQLVCTRRHRPTNGP